MGTYPIRYADGELICIGDEVLVHLPDGTQRHARIATLDSLDNQRIEGLTPEAGSPRLHLLNEGAPASLRWLISEESPLLPLNPADLTLLRRSDKIYYNNGIEMLPGDIVWENAWRRVYRFETVWRRDDPEYAWFFNEHPEEPFVLFFEPYDGGDGAFTCSYHDAVGNRSAAMDHLTFIERGDRT